MEKIKHFERLIKRVEEGAVFTVSVLIKVYQKAFSPLMGAHCRFYPSCSRYVLQSLKVRGLVSGSFYGIRRILRCNPFCEGGYDPVKPEER